MSLDYGHPPEFGYRGEYEQSEEEYGEEDFGEDTSNYETKMKMIPQMRKVQRMKVYKGMKTVIIRMRKVTNCNNL